MAGTDLEREIADAEMVLVGIGTAFDAYGMPETGREAVALKNLEHSGAAWLAPAYRDYLRARRGEERMRGALTKLCGMLEGKNYFVISEACSGEIRRIKWREGRLVMPCGDTFYKQCAANCTQEEQGNVALTDEDRAAVRECCARLSDWIGEEAEAETFLDPVRQALRMIGYPEAEDPVLSAFREQFQEGLLGKCPHCGREMILCNRKAANFDERSYLADWQHYLKWLQGTVNRRLLILELGLGMEYLDLLRMPFEKMAYLNQKSKIYRVHKDLYQLSDKIKEKGVRISENAIDWLANL